VRAFDLSGNHGFILLTDGFVLLHSNGFYGSTENAAIEGLYQLVMEQVGNCGSVIINSAECSSHSTKPYFDWPPTERSWRTNSGIVQHVDVS